MTASATLDFSALFQSRRDDCAALLHLARRQRELVAAGETTQLLALLAQKQRLLNRLDDLNRQHPELRNQWRQQRGTLDPSQRTLCDRLLAEAEMLLAELLAEDRRSTEALTRRRNETERQLQEIAAGSQIHRAYHDTLAPTTHRHLDIGQ